MTIYCDLGGLSWTALFTNNPKGYIDRLLFDDNVVLCSDSRMSIRKEHYPGYKTARLSVDAKQLERSKHAHELQQWACDRYGDRCISRYGHEADDIMASEFEPGDTLMTSDKDLLQVTGAKLIDFNGNEWGFERLQKKIKVNISTSALFL